MDREEVNYALNILSEYPGETKPELIDDLKKNSTLSKWDNFYIWKRETYIWRMLHYIRFYL